MAEYIERSAAIEAAKHAWAKVLSRRSILRPCLSPMWPRWCMGCGKESQRLIGGGRHSAR